MWKYAERVTDLIISGVLFLACQRLQEISGSQRLLESLPATVPVDHTIAVESGRNR